MHDGDESELGGFAGSDEGLVGGLEVGVEANGDEGRHEQRVSQRGAAAANEALAAPLTAVACHGRQACKAGGEFVFERAKLRHVDQQGERGGLAEAGDRGENVEADLKYLVGLKALAQGGIGGRDLSLDLLQPFRR